MRRTTPCLAARFVLLMALVAAVPAAHSCGYHDPSSVSLGMLNWAYPESLHVRTAVWMAQRDGVLATADSSTDSQSPELLKQMAQLRQTAANLGALQKGIVSALDGREIPPFSVVLIGPMLWTRFQVIDGSLTMAVHVDGPAVEDVILVTDAPVIESLAAGQLAPEEARRRGLLRWAAVGYAKGVPMGGDLNRAPNGKSPTFLVAALKDVIGANLDRIQVIKGWVDKDGKTQERVHNVAWSGDRKPGRDGKLPAVGNTVDVANATWTNTIGAPELIAVWKDPEFDAKQRALYYVRVLEIPTPRWTAYDAKRFGVKPLPGTTMVLQERAYTSPIWYTP